MSTPLAPCPGCGQPVRPYLPPRARPAGFLTLPETAVTCGRSEASLRAWRRTWLPGRPAEARKGPEPHLVDGVILYVAVEVAAWVAAHTVEAQVTASRTAHATVEEENRG